MLSEFGATDDLSVLERIAGFADHHMVSWQEWHYCGCDDPTTSGPGDVQALVKDPQKPPRGANVFRGKLKALARPYPQAIAGTPLQVLLRPDDPLFELVYTTQASRRPRKRFRRGITDVFVPKIQYPTVGGYGASGRHVAHRAGGQQLLLAAKPHAKRIRLTIAPKPRSNSPASSSGSASASAAQVVQRTVRTALLERGRLLRVGQLRAAVLATLGKLLDCALLQAHGSDITPGWSVPE